MKNLLSNNALFAILILTFFAVGCRFGNIKAEENQQANAEQTKMENEFAADSNSSKTKSQTQNVSAASVVGKYNHKTYKNGEGYDNSLEITDAGKGKLYVFISGSHNYTNNGSESFHEAEGKGDATLRGNVANATLVDEAGKPCRATITFRANEAAVKIPDHCQFNIALDGVYKKGASKPAVKETNDAPEIREISFGELYDFVNDFDKHKAGERFVITDVPASKIATVSRADRFGNTSYKNLFYLEADDEEGNVANGFAASKLLVQNLEHNADRKPAAVRVTAVLIQSTGKFDVYRMSFVTKIEGLSDGDKVIWTANGEEPVKVKFKH